MDHKTTSCQLIVGENESKAISIPPKSSTGTSFLLPFESDIDASPYTSPLLAVHFANGPPFFVHKRLVDKSPKLSACKNDKTLHLADVPRGAGHILVHYLFTGMYEYLRPSRTQRYMDEAIEFETAVRVYDVAREYELLELVDHARGEIERLGACLPAFRVLEVLEDTLPNLAINDIWIRSYLESIVRPYIDSLLSSVTEPRNSGNQALLSTYRPFKAVIERWREKTDSHSAIQNNHDEPAGTCITATQLSRLEPQSATHAVERAPGAGLGKTSKRRRRQKQKRKKGTKAAGNEKKGSSSSAALPPADMMSRCNPTVRWNGRARRHAKRMLAALDRIQSAPRPMPEEEEVGFVSQLGSPSGNCRSRQRVGSAHGSCPKQDNTRGFIAMGTPSASSGEAVSGLPDGGHVYVDELAMEYDPARDLFTQEEYEVYLLEKQEWEREWP
ncbi:hypothetical protein F5Y03DRAFT_367334 [Xylaria venustula]|nr:hypothetical protein F5Y03DRAFT_367334 [Xylaria venustula]